MLDQAKKMRIVWVQSHHYGSSNSPNWRDSSKKITPTAKAERKELRAMVESIIIGVFVDYEEKSQTGHLAQQEEDDDESTSKEVAGLSLHSEESRSD